MRHRKIIYFSTSRHQTPRQEYRSFFHYGGEHGWDIHFVMYPEASPMRTEWTESEAKIVADALALYHPDGCLVDCGLSIQMRLAYFRRIPTVFLSRPPSTIESGAVCVWSDSRVIAAEAEQQLSRLGFSDMAFVSFPDECSWSEGRREAFREIVLEHGIGYHEIRLPKFNCSVRKSSGFAKWLQCLPKPCGIFAANDVTAAAVEQECLNHSIRVPEDVAILGVDNDERLCEQALVTLSSIEQDYTASALMAAELLNAQMSSPRKRLSGQTYGISRVVLRESCNPYRSFDRSIRTAIEFIRRHACESGFSVPQVARAMGCSRRMADIRFAKYVKHTILDEIHAVRIETAKRLLKNPAQTPVSVSDRCGFASVVDFRRVFKRIVGEPPGHWR